MDFPYIKAFISSIEAIFEGFSISRPQGEKILRFWRHFQGDFDDFSKEKSFQILKIFSSKILKYKGGYLFGTPNPQNFPASFGRDGFSLYTGLYIKYRGHIYSF